MRESFTFRVTIVLDHGNPKNPGDTMIVAAGSLTEPHYILLTGTSLDKTKVGKKLMLLLRTLTLPPKPQPCAEVPAVEAPPVAPTPAPVLSAVETIRVAARAAKKRAKVLQPVAGT